MATWTFKATLTLASTGVRQVATGNNKAYFIDNFYGGSPFLDVNPLGKIVEYDPTGNTQTTILTPASYTDHLRTFSLAWFQGNLYAALLLDHGATIEGVVIRYDGTPESWTVVYSTGTSNVGDRYIKLYVTDSEMVYLGREGSPAPGFCNVAYTSDGTNWSSGSISPLPVQPGNPSNPEFDGAVYWPLGIFERFCNAVSGSNCSNIDVYAYSNGAWSIFSLTPAQILLQSSPNGSVHFAGGGSYKMSYNMATAAQIDSNIGALYLSNAVGFAIGVDPQASTTLLYKFDGVNSWTLQDTLSLSSGVTPQFAEGAGWICNLSSSALLLAENGNTGNWEVWQRSEAFAASALAQFYYGTNTPTYRSDLPIPGVLPGAMEITKSQKVALVGTNQAHSSAIAYATNPYTSWQNMTPVVTTGTAVTSIKNV